MAGRPEGGERRHRKTIAALLLSIALTALLPAPAAADIDARFRTWLQTDLWPDAEARGISRTTFERAFDGVRPDMKLPGLARPGEEAQVPRLQHQAEFGSPAPYFAEKTLAAVASGGRARARRHAAILARIEQRYGVPGSVVLAIWGRETGYGAAKLRHDAFAVLGTRAFLSASRRPFYRAELLAALEIVQRGLEPVDAMKASWAGALGQPQFMPSSFLEHAVDFDGDGRVDIWNSVPDVLASIAGYLAHYGWVSGRDWGFEVTVPQDVSCALEGPDRGRPIGDWAKLGIARVGGKPFPAHEAKAEGFLVMPAGRHGPAFIATPNFYVLKEYNTSDLYALFIGLSADRIAYGDRRFHAGWAPVDGLYRSDIAAMQRALERQGYDVGGVDGLPGFRTRRSIGEWQEKNGRAATCFPDAAMVKALK